ncbi:MAG: hypothetical protein WD423_07790 [Rhodothermales bacterium]
MAAVLCLAWSVGLDREWGTDFGVYYVGASLLSDDFQLYADHFDHKGPAYYIFLTAIGNVIGSGAVQAVVSLFLTALAYACSVLAIARRYTSSIPALTLVVLFTGASLAAQNSNASIALFQTALLLWSFHLLLKNRETGRRGFLYGSFGVFSLVVLTRIDAVLFAPMYFFVHPQEGRLREWLSSGALGIAIFGLVFFAHALLLDFTPGQFFVHNVAFNQVHGSAYARDVLYLAYRPILFGALLMSGLPLLLLLVVPDRFQKPDALFVTIAAIGATVLFYTNSDKNYYLFVLLAPLLMYVLSRLRRIPRRWTPAIVLTAAFLTVAVLQMAYGTLLPFVADLRNGTAFSLKSETDLAITSALKDVHEGNVVLNRSWIYLFSGTPPGLGLNPLIYVERYDENLNVLEETGMPAMHERLISSEGSRVFLAPGSESSSNPYVQDLIDHSEAVDTVRSGGDFVLVAREIR